LCAPDTLITLPVPFSTGRGRARRAIEAFYAAPVAVANAVTFIEIGNGADSTTTLVFRPPDDWATSFVRIGSRPRRAHLAVRGETVRLNDEGALAVRGRGESCSQEKITSRATQPNSIGADQ
jgi:hypothetical protein